MSNSQIPFAAHSKESNLTHSIQVEMLFNGYARIKGLYEIWVPYLTYVCIDYLWHIFPVECQSRKRRTKSHPCTFALPFEEHGFLLSKGAFQDALCLRYGWPIAGISS